MQGLLKTLNPTSLTQGINNLRPFQHIWGLSLQWPASGDVSRRHRGSLWVRLEYSGMLHVGLYNREKGCNQIDPSPIKSVLSLNVFEVLFFFLVQWEVKWFLYHILLKSAAAIAVMYAFSMSKVRIPKNLKCVSPLQGDKRMYISFCSWHILFFLHDWFRVVVLDLGWSDNKIRFVVSILQWLIQALSIGG